MSRRAAGLLLVLGALLGLTGSVAPWLPHRAAGLSAGGFTLFELTKFLPGVRSGAVPLFREAFLLPLLTSAVLLALAPASFPHPPRWVRWILPLAAAFVVLLALPSYPAILTAHRDPEYRGQLLLAGGTFLLVVISPLARRLSPRAFHGLAAFLVVVGLLPALLTFLHARAMFAQLYNAPVGIGWGIPACALGGVLVLASGLAAKKKSP